MPTYRVKAPRFTSVPNPTVRDPRLSTFALGLLTFLLSYPDDWKFNMDWLVNNRPEGRDKVRSGVRELEQLGYIVRRKKRGQDGRFTSEMEVYNYPQTEASKATATEETEGAFEDGTAAELPPAEQPDMDAPHVDTPPMDEPPTAGPRRLDRGGKPVGLTKTVKTKTVKQKTRVKPTTVTTTNARAPVAAAAADVVVAAADLPDEIKAALKALGWVGSTAEIARAWGENPDRVRAWLDYAYSHNWSAALLRHTLRTDPDMPPNPADERARFFAGWEDFAENGNDETALPPPETTGAPVAAPPAPPDMAQSPVLAAAPPDIGVAEAGNGASASRKHPPPAVPPDVLRWWEIARGELQANMPKAAFDTWVRPARALTWRDEDGRAALTVAVANDYARRWLQERVARILGQKLTGLVGKPVSLEVVVE